MVNLTFKDLMFKGEIEIIQLVILTREDNIKVHLLLNKIQITPLIVVFKNLIAIILFNKKNLLHSFNMKVKKEAQSNLHLLWKLKKKQLKKK